MSSSRTAAEAPGRLAALGGIAKVRRELDNIRRGDEYRHELIETLLGALDENEELRQDLERERAYNRQVQRKISTHSNGTTDLPRTALADWQLGLLRHRQHVFIGIDANDILIKHSFLRTGTLGGVRFANNVENQINILLRNSNKSVSNPLYVWKIYINLADFEARSRKAETASFLSPHNVEQFFAGVSKHRILADTIPSSGSKSKQHLLLDAEAAARDTGCIHLFLPASCFPLPAAFPGGSRVTFFEETNSDPPPDITTIRFPAIMYDSKTGCTGSADEGSPADTNKAAADYSGPVAYSKVVRPDASRENQWNSFGTSRRERRAVSAQSSTTDLLVSDPSESDSEPVALIGSLQPLSPVRPASNAQVHQANQRVIVERESKSRTPSFKPDQDCGPEGSVGESPDKEESDEILSKKDESEATATAAVSAASPQSGGFVPDDGSGFLVDIGWESRDRRHETATFEPDSQPARPLKTSRSKENQKAVPSTAVTAGWPESKPDRVDRFELARPESNDGMSTTEKTESPNRSSGPGRKSPPSTSSSSSTISTDRNETIYRNIRGERIDQHIPYGSRVIVNRIRGLRLCNFLFLKGRCALTDGSRPTDQENVEVGLPPYAKHCKNLHDYNPTSEELEALRSLARTLVCPAGSACDDRTCFFGHVCSRETAGEKCPRVKCKFPAFMHGMELQPVDENGRPLPKRAFNPVQPVAWSSFRTVKPPPRPKVWIKQDIRPPPATRTTLFNPRFSEGVDRSGRASKPSTPVPEPVDPYLGEFW